MSDGKLLPFRRVEGRVDEVTDRALVSAIAEGDQAALGALYDRYHRDVYRFVARLARVSEADDFVQMTFLEARRSASRFRGDAQVKTWLFGIAANLVRSHVRGEQRKKRAHESLQVIPKRPPTNPGEAITREQQRQWLAAAIESLTPALREAYLLCVIEELPGKEAALALGIREASLWRRLSDARAELKKAIEEMQR
jgi:RNA polymerase sigma-70 factor (ECF subfamily)